MNLLKLYLFTLTPSTTADFQGGGGGGVGGRENIKKKTIYIHIIQMKTINTIDI